MADVLFRGLLLHEQIEGLPLIADGFAVVPLYADSLQVKHAQLLACLRAVMVCRGLKEPDGPFHVLFHADGNKEGHAQQIFRKGASAAGPFEACLFQQFFQRRSVMHVHAGPDSRKCAFHLFVVRMDRLYGKHVLAPLPGGTVLLFPYIVAFLQNMRRDGQSHCVAFRKIFHDIVVEISSGHQEFIEPDGGGSRGVRIVDGLHDLSCFGDILFAVA